MHIFPTVTRFAAAHKFISAVAIIVVLGGGYLGFKHFTSTAEVTRFVLGTVSKGTIITTVTGSGQVSASNQMNVTAKTSGTLVALNATVGQEVKAGALIGQVDSSDAANALQNAKLSYQELTTIDPTKLRDAQNAVAKAQTTEQNDYVTALATLASASIDMSSTIDSLTDLFVGGYVDPTNKFNRSQNAKDLVSKAQTSYHEAQSKLNAFTKEYNALSNTSSSSTVKTMLEDEYQVALSVAQAAKYTKDATAYLRDHEVTQSTTADAAYTTVTDLVTKTSATVSTLLSGQNGLNDDALALRNAQEDLATLLAGPTALDLNSSQITLEQKQKAYADNFIRAPFDGVIASVPVQKGDSVSNGTTLVTLITKEEIAEISLNEVDAAKVQVGQKVTLTFDAIDGLSITGKVTSIDLVGTVSQGVVEYKVQIGFDTSDPRVKPGMTANASIITDIHQDVLMVPSSAIKTQGTNSYVEVVDPAVAADQIGQTAGVVLTSTPKVTTVTTGLSDDTSTEIVEGLTEGEQYVVRTITETSKTTSSAPSLFGGGPRTGTGAVRGAATTGNRTFGG